MPGRQQDFAVEGDRYENAVQSILSEALSLVRVPRQRDFGIDFYCLVMERLVEGAQTTRDLFALQVGGPGKKVVFGGKKRGKSRRYEIEWLKTLTIPFYFARVSAHRDRVHIYSLSPVWRVLFQSPNAFKIVCKMANPSPSEVVLAADPIVLSVQKPTPDVGDGREWLVDLGPPLLSVCTSDLQDKTIEGPLINVLRAWLQIDWTTAIRFQSRISLQDFVLSWRTNSIEGMVPGQELRWSHAPGVNVQELLKALHPALVTLGANLQWQDSSDAYELLPLLKLAQRWGLSTPFSEGLTEGLQRQHRAARTPLGH